MSFGIGPLELALLMLLGGGLLFALIIGILLIAFKKRPEQPGWQAPHPGPPQPGPPQAGASQAPPGGIWNAEVVPPGGFGLTGRTSGLFRLEHGVLSFWPAGAQTPLWAVPCRDLAVGSRSMFTFEGADLRLLGPMGEWYCSVSEEHINRFMQNTMKSFRQRRYAADFIHLLRWYGAGVA